MKRPAHYTWAGLSLTVPIHSIAVSRCWLSSGLAGLYSANFVYNVPHTLLGLVLHVGRAAWHVLPINRPCSFVRCNTALFLRAVGLVGQRASCRWPATTKEPSARPENEPSHRPSAAIGYVSAGPQSPRCSPGAEHVGKRVVELDQAPRPHPCC